MNLQNPEYPENGEAAKRYQITSVPTIVFAGADGGMIAKHVGFIPPNDFVPVIEAALAKERALIQKLAELEKTPDDAKLNAQVAITYLERGQLEKALPFAQKTLEHDPGNSTGLLPRLHYQLGVTYAKKVENAKAADPKKADMYFEKAVAHLKVVIGKYSQSEVYENTQYYLGVTYAIKGHFEDAIAVLEKLVHHTTDAQLKQRTESLLEQVKRLAGSK